MPFVKPVIFTWAWFTLVLALSMLGSNEGSLLPWYLVALALFFCVKVMLVLDDLRFKRRDT